MNSFANPCCIDTYPKKLLSPNMIMENDIEMMNEKLNEVMSYFDKQNIIYMATVEDDQPRVRPVSLIFFEDNFYVITGARGGVNAAKLRQIRKNPKLEYYLTISENEKTGFIRGESTASIIDDRELKKRLYKEIDWVKNYFESPLDLSYVLLQIFPKVYVYRKPGETEIITIKVA